MRVMVRVAAWCAAKPCLHGARAIAREPTSNRPSACVTRSGPPDLQHLRQALQRRRAVVAHTLYECPVAANATSASVAAQTASSLAVP